MDFEGNYIGPSSGISFLSRAWRRLNEDYGSTVPTGVQHESPQNVSVFSFGDRPFAASSASDITLPDRQTAAELIAMFFDYAVVTYRLLHRETLERWLMDLYEIGEDLSNRMPTSNAGRAAVVFVVFALARLHQESRSSAQSEVSNGQSRFVLPVYYLVAH